MDHGQPVLLLPRDGEFDSESDDSFQSDILAESYSSEDSPSFNYNEGGYDYEFVDMLRDNLVCKICHYPSREPHLSVCCGHTFCHSCITKAKKSTALTDACPVCRIERFTTVPNKQNERDVLSLHVLCTNNKRGCDWIGEVGDITKHLTSDAGCKFEEIRCPNSCGKKVERRYLADHVEECPRRLVSCQYCHTEGEYQFIEGSHKEQCDKFPVPCPNNCEIGCIPRQDLQEHKTVCPLENVHCQYHDVGCDAKIARKDLVKHSEENTNKHLLLMKSTLTDTQSKLADTQSKLVDTQNKLADTQSKLTMTENKLDDTKYRLSSTENELKNTKYKLSDIANELDDAKDQLTDELEDTKCKLSDIDDDTKNKLANTELTLTNTRCNLTTTKDKLTKTNQRMNAAEKRLKDNHDTVLVIMVSLQHRIDELETTLKQKTKLFDNLFGKWTTEIHTKAAELSSCAEEFPVIVKMPEFTDHMTNKLEWYSDPFFTDDEGYKMQLMVVAAGRGSGEGRCMSVYLCIMDGPYDYLLKWKLRGKFQVTLLNQISDSLHRSASYRVYANRGQSRPFWYCEELIPYEDLFKITSICQFLKDDSVFFEVCELDN